MTSGIMQTFPPIRSPSRPTTRSRGPYDQEYAGCPTQPGSSTSATTGSRARMWTVVAMAVVVAAIAGAYVALATRVLRPGQGDRRADRTPPSRAPRATHRRSSPTWRWKRRSCDRSTSPAVGEDPVRDASEQLVKSVRVEPVRDGAVMYVGYSSSRPETAATIANAFAQQYSMPGRRRSRPRSTRRSSPSRRWSPSSRRIGRGPGGARSRQ